MRSFLLLAPYFAPQAAVGAYRWVKLARTLVRRGFRPVVVTGTFPDAARDPDLLAAVPPEVSVHDVYLDPRLLQATDALRALSARLPRPKKSPGPLRPIEGLRPFQSVTDHWTIHALHGAREAKRIARQEGVSAVVVTAGPFSAVPSGVSVARALGLPLVLDFRDPWGLHESGAAPPQGAAEWGRHQLVAALERRILARADHVVLNTRRALAAYQERYPFLVGKSSFVRNHFDASLYDPAPASPEPPSRFTILHTGTLRAETRVDDIGQALRRIIDREKLTPADLVLRQIGRATAYEHAEVARMGLSDFVEFAPPIPQRALLGELRCAHVLLSMVDPRVMLRIAAKTYDYIASGMPIVSITENPEVDELLAHRPDNKRIRPGDIDALVASLSAHFERFRATRALPSPVPAPSEFSSETAADRFAAVFERLMR
ncbi:glycosyltransferase [Polyangium mundeleinium]|uniref:Glycosyltransferase n=1 Tax=Polyangium mundeleinium TaxID=2995306 RepID=A0ABT5ET29_9BACT|nr:glycosyltransferase [Polyangium mundeleinium]MDC0744977.1 glycosyltransferase [Polyangium mundeleinium]